VLFLTNCKKILGAPGTGKTHRCIDVIKENLRNGGCETDILYTTYRREAADDAVLKISNDTGIKPQKLKRLANTTHGICLSLLLKNGFVKPKENHNFLFHELYDIPKFNKKYGYNLKANGIGIDAINNGTADPFLQTYSVMRATRTPLNDVYKIGLPLQYSINDFKQIVHDLEEWKQENGKLEFADMIDTVIEEGLCPECSLQIYDECQDMTSQMYIVSKMWADNADDVVLAGDHLQTLYPHIGANPRYFLDWDGELEVIPESRRLTSETWEIAKDVIQSNTPYEAPDIKTRAENGLIAQMNFANLDHYFANGMPKNDTFHLVRANYMGGFVADKLACAGIPFSGIEQYAWKPVEMDLFNAIHAIRSFRQLKTPEFCAIIDKYPARLTVAPSSLVEKSALKERVQKGEQSTSMSMFSQHLIESIKSDDPLKLSLVKNEISIKKIMGALNRELPGVTQQDIDRVKVLTIHGSKGMQATTNFLHMSVPNAVTRSMMTKKGRENEAYVWYVGVTRTFNNLVFVNYNTPSYHIRGVCV